jgi:hypothetical protein
MVGGNSLMENNYLNDLKIEVDALDIEWLRHPHKFAKYSEQLAVANDRVRKSKNELDIIDAQLDKEIRDFSEKKPTEAQIKNEIIQDERHLEALSKHNKALYEAEVLQGVVRAFDARKHTLQAMVQLISVGYLSTPKVPKELKKDKDPEADGIAEVNKRVRERLKNKAIVPEGN